MRGTGGESLEPGSLRSPQLAGGFPLVLLEQRSVLLRSVLRTAARENIKNPDDTHLLFTDAEQIRRADDSALL